MLGAGGAVASGQACRKTRRNGRFAVRYFDGAVPSFVERFRCTLAADR